jgi:cytochrome c-type biogenesis protein CcsB
MQEIEIGLHWAAVGLYALSSVLLAAGLIFQREQAVRLGVGVAVFGLAFHSIALGIRWVEAGHGPYLRRYEVYSSAVWVLVGAYLLAVWRRPALGPVGALVMPAAFLMIGMGVMSSPEIRALPPTFRNLWLPVHIFFANLAFGSCLIGTGIAGIYLLKRRAGPDAPFYARLPDFEALDELSYRAIAFGFIALAIMIIAGAIWANSAWGRYWGWDPVETWSLISWVVYGIYLHLRRMHGWRGARAAWFAVGAVVLLIFAMFGLGVVYPGSEHSPYVSG